MKTKKMTTAQATFAAMVEDYNRVNNKNIPVKQRYSKEFLEKIVDRVVNNAMPSHGEIKLRQSRAIEYATQKMGTTKNTTKHTQHAHKQKKVQRMAMN